MSLSINGLGSALPDPIGTRRDEPADSGRSSLSEGAAQSAAADAFVRSTDSGLASGVDPDLWALLSTEERDAIETGTQELRRACEGEDHNAIRDVLEVLNEKSQAFAQRIMDESISTALESRSVDEISS